MYSDEALEKVLDCLMEGIRKSGILDKMLENVRGLSAEEQTRCMLACRDFSDFKKARQRCNVEAAKELAVALNHLRRVKFHYEALHKHYLDCRREQEEKDIISIQKRDFVRDYEEHYGKEHKNEDS